MEVRRLLWDDHNIEHIARHKVSPIEAEEVVFGEETRGPYRDDRRRPGRLVFIGNTVGLRPLVVVTDPPTPNGDAYVVTARPATERERERYLEAP